MRLLNTATLEVEDYIGSNVPAYAILSHTWGDQEVTLQEWIAYRQEQSHHHQLKGNGTSQPRKSHLGRAKIESFGRVARRDGHDHVWVDTCCIDKTSSAELTESINSMFQWYKDASVCYAYLSDFGQASAAGGGGGSNTGGNAIGREQQQQQQPTSTLFYGAAKDCHWFTRGWTLQELIAPRDLRFYDGQWRFCGTRDEHGRDLEAITGIDYSVLLGPRHPEYVAPAEYSVADRMSWASSRRTKRTEDIAYCLLGLFGVHMPLIYGEETGAFRRLQEAIIQNSNDLSILAWGMSQARSEEERRENRWLQGGESGYSSAESGLGAETAGENGVWADMMDQEDEHQALFSGTFMRSETAIGRISRHTPASLAVRPLSPPPPPPEPGVRRHQRHRNLFASAPSDFAQSRHISKPFRHWHSPEFTMTNKGLRIKARIFKGVYDGGTARGYFLYLAEQDLVDSSFFAEHLGAKTQLWLRLRKTWIDMYVPEALVEHTCGQGRDGQVDFSTYTGLTSFYITHRPRDGDDDDDEVETLLLRHPSSGIHIPRLAWAHMPPEPYACNICLRRTIPESHWDETRQLFYELDEADPIVLAAEFEAHFGGAAGATAQFIVLFDRTVTCDEDNPFLCRVLDCRQYPREAEWIFSNRGTRSVLLWCDLEYHMKEISQCTNDIQIETGEGVAFGLRVGLELQEMWTLGFDIRGDEMKQQDCGRER